jgi:membrane-bound lytic murein transglycosylase D
MRTAGILVLLLAGLLLARGQDNTRARTNTVPATQNWTQKRIDTNVFVALQSLNQQKVHQYFRDLQQRFQGEYVVTLASFQDTAEALLPWLERQPATRPYGDWVKARLDYFGVIDEIRFTIPPPEVETNQLPGPVPNLVLTTLQKMWLRKVEGDSLSPKITNYLVCLKAVFLAQRVPPELFWLAEVESAFNASAHSRGGAVGLFQLKADTARRFGLSLSPFDQRLDPEANARASAQYLKYLYDYFQDWRLVLAGYNAGENKVQKLLTRYHTRNYDDIARRLPAETRAYVPRVEAILKRREGVSLTELHTPPDWIVRKIQDHE